MTKTLHKVDIKGTCHIIIQTTYIKHTANIILNSKKLKVLSLRLGTRQDPHSHHLFSIVLEVLAAEIRQEIKGI